MLADEVDRVIGVDTHRDHHSAAVTTTAGAVTAQHTVAADGSGYEELLRFADGQAPGARAWAIEGTGSYGAGLAAFLVGRGERVVEIDRPKRPARRDGAKSDELDAIRAAREALSREHLAQPRQRGWHEALRVLMATRQGAVTAQTRAIGQLKSMIVSAPDALRAQLRGRATDHQLARCARLRTSPSHDLEHRATVIALRAAARRALALRCEAHDLEAEITQLVGDLAPDLLAEFGIGPITAAQILLSYSHHQRFRNESAFAAHSGTSPIPASSGQTVRHRLNRSGDRKLNRALHVIVLTRVAHDPETRTYIERRTAEGKTPRETRRCLKRYTARRIWRLLQTNPNLAPPAATI
jgi:transposase